MMRYLFSSFLWDNASISLIPLPSFCWVVTAAIRMAGSGSLGLHELGNTGTLNRIHWQCFKCLTVCCFCADHQFRTRICRMPPYARHQPLVQTRRSWFDQGFRTCLDRVFLATTSCHAVQRRKVLSTIRKMRIYNAFELEGKLCNAAQLQMQLAVSK